MYRKFITTIIAAALAVTVIGNAPARANDNLVGAFAAIAGIAIVGKVIHDHNKKKYRVNTVPQGTHKKFGHRNSKHIYNAQPRSVPKRTNRRLLPGDCLRSAQTRQGRLRYFGEHCLQRSYTHANRLPQTCAVRVRGKGRGYEATCLRNQGYQLARR